MVGGSGALRHHGPVTTVAVKVTVNVAALRALGAKAGLDAVGVARAEPFETTRVDLEQRRQAGLAAGMAFTYKNPERSTSPQLLLRNARSLVVGARSYHRQMPTPPCPGGDDTGEDPLVGRVGRYVWEDHYGALRVGLDALAAHLRRHGHRAAVFIDSNHLVDREAAYRAGLGWYGKNTNLLLPDRGSWFVLGSVVTDADLAADHPQPDGCGTCRRCLDNCPTAALPEPGVLDANRCLAWLAQRPGLFPAEFRVALHDRIYGCDDCQTVCPPNRREEQRVDLRVGTAPRPAVWLALLELLEASEETLLERWGQFYLFDRRTFALRRNALLALGNTAPASDERVPSCLRRYLGHDDPLLRATAVWAARRLGLDHLARLAAADPDARVRAELEGSVPQR